MKFIVTILFFFSIPSVKAQGISKLFLDSIFKAANPDVLIDSIRSYQINYTSFDSKDAINLNHRLRQISKDSIARIVYLDFDNRSYSGKQTLFLDLVRKQKQEDIKELLAGVNDIYFKDYWKRRSGGKKPILIVDYKVIEEAKIKQVLNGLDVKTIFSIMITGEGKNASLLTEAAKDGTVQIWLRGRRE